MIALYAPPAFSIPELSGNTFLELEIVRCADWGSFREARARAQCAILIIPHLTAELVREHLQITGSLSSLPPTVLVTETDPASLRWLAGAAVHEVVWLAQAGR
ncbi:MAG TPA: hypothetical protein VFQ45_16085, partial [Longimicrobium sp.]|nr:hypothetical protein [Longimicrobium sp.]